ncbi:hypothetical protein FOZ63_034050, partial [Perkinsus olseni]
MLSSTDCRPLHSAHLLLLLLVITPCCVAAASTGDGGGDSPPPRSVLSPYLRRSDDWLILANILAVLSFGITQYFAEAERKRKGDPDAPPAIRRKKREIEEKQPEGNRVVQWVTFGRIGNDNILLIHCIIGKGAFYCLVMNSIPDCCTDITSNHLPWRPYLTQKEQHTPQGETVFNFFDNRQGSHVAAAHEPTLDENQSSTAVEELLKCQYCDNFTVVRTATPQPGGGVKVSVSTRIPTAPPPATMRRPQEQHQSAAHEGNYAGAPTQPPQRSGNA